MSLPTDSAAPRPAPGRPKDPAKRAAILEAAERMFLEHGFDGVSMDQIASAAGVSKLTVYSHFGDKDTLFIAAVEHYCGKQVPESLFAPDPTRPMRPRLEDIARAVLALMASPESVSGFRLMCAPARRDPALAEHFWRAGAGKLQDGFAALLARRTAAGELAIEDTARAAVDFFSLLRGDLHPRLILGSGIPAGFDMDAHVRGAVDTFLRAYAAVPGGAGRGRQAR